MFPLSTTAKNVIEQNVSVSYRSACTIEYNMNSLVDNVIVTGADITKTDSGGNSYKPFQKLFPVDSIVKPFRPNAAGIKYAISGDIASGDYRDPRAVTYDKNFRLYYPGADTSYKYYLSGKGVGLDVTVSYPKTILTNKIIARFELSHSTPGTWTIFGNGTQLATGTSSDIVPFTTGGNVNYNSGTVTIYYNGTSWSTTEPTSPAAPISLTSVKITTGAVANKYTGLIELSPRWYVDLTDYVVDFQVSKESSTSTEDLMPVGKVSANSLALSLVSYEADRKIISFDKTENFNASKIYMYKQVELRPYIKIYHSGGAKTDSYGKYDSILQGTFFIDNWSTSEFGDISVSALDGAKILQETIAPGILCEGYSVTAIIRRLLDGVGFTNYKINVKSTDASIFSPRYWWTDNTKTVWDALQELCRDAQMTAVFSYDNVLQFYTREYLFDNSKSPVWTFRSDSSGSDLSNIISFNKNDLPSANQIKVFWNSVSTSNYIQGSQDIWKSDPYFLGAFAVNNDIPSNQPAGTYISLAPSVINEEESSIATYEFSGYLIIDSEIIEYDAVEFQYEDLNGVVQKVNITNRSDLLKYIGIGKAGSSYTKPTGRYRIKSRGAFGTTVANHYAAAQSIIDSWEGYQVTWV